MSKPTLLSAPISAKSFSNVILLGVYPNIGKQPGLCDASPFDVRIKYIENYLLDCPSITPSVYDLLQKHYYLDVVFGKNGFLYVSPIATTSSDKKHFSISITKPGNETSYCNIGGKLRIISDDTNEKSFSTSCLGDLSELRSIACFSLVPGAKRTDIIFGPNCKALVEFLHDAGVEELNSVASWKNSVGTADSVIDSKLMPKKSVFQDVATQLVDYYLSNSFINECSKKHKNRDCSSMCKYKAVKYDTFKSVKIALDAIKQHNK